MQAAIFAAAGGPEVITFAERPVPAPGAGEVRVRVRAAGLNRADILQRRGQYPAPPGWPAEIPGLEFAGEVEQLGAGVTRWREGDRVMGLVGGGAMAEALVVPADELLAVPSALTITDAAAVPEAFLTAWDALTARGQLREGQRLLVHAVASGVGTAAVQLARLLGAQHVAGTSRSAAKLARCAALGLDLGLDTATNAAFADRLPAPVDVIVDVLGGPAFSENLRALAPFGRLVMLGFLQGARSEADLAPILRKRLTITGATMRTRLGEERRPLVAEFAARVLPALADGRLTPVVHAVRPMAELAVAHAEMERDETFGKVVLRW